MRRAIAIVGVLLIAWGAWSLLRAPPDDVGSESADRAGGASGDAPVLAGAPRPADRSRAEAKEGAVARAIGEEPANVFVTVLDPDGKPVYGATVELFRHGEGDLALDWGLESGSTTDPHGRAGLHCPDLHQTYRLGAVSRREGVGEYDDPAWKPGDTTIRLPRTYSIRGVVRDLSGAPIEHAELVAVPRTKTGESFSMNFRTRAEGIFELHDIPEGPVDLIATVNMAWLLDERAGARVARRTVSAGDEGIAIVLDAGATLSVKVDASPAEASGFVATLTRDGDATGETSIHKPVADDGTLEFPRLPTDATYVLSIGPTPSGGTAYVRGLRPGAPTAVVPLKPGASIRGRLLGPVGLEDFAVLATGPGLAVHGTVDRLGAFEVNGLRPGTWKITATATRTGVPVAESAYEGTADTAAGSAVDVTLRSR